MSEVSIINNRYITQHTSEVLNFKGDYPEIITQENYTSIRTIGKNIGEQECRQLMYAINHKILNAGIDVDPTNIKLLNEYILENYPDISLADIKVFSKKLLTGYFIGKKITDDVIIKVFKYDVPTLCLMFQKYYAERMEAIEKLRQDQHLKDTKQPIHSDVLKMLSDVGEKEIGIHRQIYRSIDEYCELNNIDIHVFEKAYTDLYISHENHDQYDEEKRNAFVSYKMNRFVVFQNQINTQKDLNTLIIFNKMCYMCEVYDIDGLINLAKELAVWGIPTKYYYAAKKILFEGGEIKFRYDITNTFVKNINEFVVKYLKDESQSTYNSLFVLSLIFNFSLNLSRFNKANGIEQ